MNEKKRIKQLKHAEMVWEREQLNAAAAQERLDQAWATVESFKDELDDKQRAEVETQLSLRRQEIKDALLKSRDKYVAKLRDLNGNV